MRPDTYFARLYGLASENAVDAKRLARALMKTIVQVSEMSPNGPDAVQLVRNTMLRETLRTHVGIGRRARKSRTPKATVNDNDKKNNDKPARSKKEKDAPARPRMSEETRNKIAATMKKRHKERRKRHDDFISESIAS